MKSFNTPAELCQTTSTSLGNISCWGNTIDFGYWRRSTRQNAVILFRR